MLGPPVLVFCVLCALGIMGVALGADKLEADERARAESAALDWVRVQLAGVHPFLRLSHICCSLVFTIISQQAEQLLPNSRR